MESYMVLSLENYIILCACLFIVSYVIFKFTSFSKSESGGINKKKLEKEIKQCKNDIEKYSKDISTAHELLLEYRKCVESYKVHENEIIFNYLCMELFYQYFKSVKENKISVNDKELDIFIKLSSDKEYRDEFIDSHLDDFIEYYKQTGKEDIVDLFENFKKSSENIEK